MKEYQESFSIEYDKIADQIVCEVDVMAGIESYKCQALVDTGSSQCCISRRVIDALELYPVGRADVLTANGTISKDIYYVDLQIQDSIILYGLDAFYIDDSNFDFIIGMNVISQGDMQILNRNGTTTFSFGI